MWSNMFGEVKPVEADYTIVWVNAYEFRHKNIFAFLIKPRSYIKYHVKL